jgi:serine/threonine-protein kinase
MAGDLLYYTMPFVEGKSLRAYLSNGETIPLERALQIGREVADALAYAHARGFVHRDIKPENILLDSGHAVVTDFGIARAISASSTSAITATGLGIGTPAYMSPEQLDGDAALDARSDIYSLGCVLYEMITGQSPATAAARVRAADRHVRQFGKVLPVLAKALAPEPSERFDSASDFQAALAIGYANNRRQRIVASTAILALVICTAGIGLWALGRTSQPTAVWSRSQVSAVGRARDPAISADGEFVAYVSDSSLYVSELSNNETRLLATGYGIMHPSWVSNNSEVAYQQLDVVYAVPRAGGPRREIARRAYGSYAISPDGERIAHSPSNGALYLTTLKQTPTTVTLTTDSNSRGPTTGITRLRWSPDGKWLAGATLKVLLVFSADGRERHAFRMSADSNPFFLLPFGRWMSWSARSDTVYFDRVGVSASHPRGVVGAVALDRRGRWTLSVPVDTPANFEGSALSGDGRRYAYVTRSGRSRLLRYEFNSSAGSPRTPASRGVASDRFYDFSPDGKLGAFVRRLASGSDVYTAAANGDEAQRITKLSAQSLHSVRWSPDGSRIAFISDGAGSSTIYVVDPRTGESRQFASTLPTFQSVGSPAIARVTTNALAWSNDGSRLYFGASPFVPSPAPGVHPRKIGGIATIDLRSGRDSMLDSHGGLSPVVSPSGEQVGFRSGADSTFVRLDLRTGRRDTTILPFKADPLKWKSDGSLLMTRVDSGATEIWQWWPSSGKRKRVATIPSVCVMLTLAPDEHSAVCEEVESESEIWIASSGRGRKGAKKGVENQSGADRSTPSPER